MKKILLIAMFLITGGVAWAIPGVPTGVGSSDLQSTEVKISWTASTGSPVGYTLYRNGVAIQTTTLLYIYDNFIVPNTAYTYTVDAYDAGNNHSAQSSPVAITTLTQTSNPACSSSNLHGYTCTTVAAGYTGGTLACKADGSGYDMRGCIAGGTLAAASCNQWDVQNALNNATNGETVTIPAGTCTWTWPVVIGLSFGQYGIYLASGSFSTNSPDTTTYPGMSVYPGTSVVLVYNGTTWISNYPQKSVIVKGAGVGQTIIIDQRKTNLTYGGDTIYPTPMFNIIPTSTAPVRVTGITFDGAGTESSNGVIQLSGTTGGVQWRIDHNDFTDLTQEGILTSNSYGVIDHNTIENKSGSDVTGVSIGGNGDISWALPTTFGTENAVYMEDNVWTWTGNASNGAQDAYVGARYVSRYNTIINTWGGHHGFDSQQRGIVSWEVYNNLIYTTINDQDSDLWESRSGTGVIFNNVIPVDRSAGMVGFQYLRNYRSDQAALANYDEIVPTNLTNWLGNCNGSSYLLTEVYSGGSGYMVGDILTAVQTGGSGLTVEVTKLNGSAVSFVIPVTPGSGYTTESTTGTPTTGGHGTGATLDIAFDGNATPVGEGYPCQDQNGFGPPGQTAIPIYAWHNWFGGTMDGHDTVQFYSGTVVGTDAATSISSVSIASGGTGYVIGDIATIVQTGGSLGKVTVTSVSSGVVTGISQTSGSSPTAYGTGYADASALPTTGGTGTGLTVNISCPETYTIAVGSGGSGYALNDVLAASQSSTVPSRSLFVRVTSVSGSAVTGVAELPDTSGTGYQIANGIATVPQSNTSGTGATINITAITPRTIMPDITISKTIIEGRDFYNCPEDGCTTSPTYVPYIYPDPLVQMDTPYNPTSNSTNNISNVILKNVTIRKI